MILHADVIVLILAFVTSVFSVAKKENPSYLVPFFYFLLVSVMVELTGAYLNSMHQSNTLLYNVFSAGEFSFYFYFFSRIVTNATIKSWTRFLIFIFPTACFLNIFLIQGPHTFHTYTFSLGCVITDALGILYFLQIFNDKKRINLLREPAFWIIFGLLFYLTTSLFFFGILNYVSTLPRAITVSMVKLMIFVNVLLYTLFILAFVCRLITPKSTPNT